MCETSCLEKTKQKQELSFSVCSHPVLFLLLLKVLSKVAAAVRTGEPAYLEVSAPVRNILAGEAANTTNVPGKKM